jgi:acyl carrier protein
VDLTNMRGIVKQALPTRGAFGDPEFRNTHGDYFAVEVVVPNIDPFATSLLHIDYDKYAEFDKYVHENEVYVRPLLIQDEDTKVVVWELEEDNEFKKIPEIKVAPKKEAAPEYEAPATSAKAAPESAVSEELDEIAQTVIQCAADAYGVDASKITLATDIREDLSNESMKMIVMISSIEDETNVTIEIQEASALMTIADFVNKVRERI